MLNAVQLADGGACRESPNDLAGVGGKVGFSGEVDSVSDDVCSKTRSISPLASQP